VTHVEEGEVLGETLNRLSLVFGTAFRAFNDMFLAVGLGMGRCYFHESVLDAFLTEGMATAY
jgi:hypothetical protein